MKKRFLLIGLLLMGTFCAASKSRKTGAPYLTGDTFRAEIADLILDETNRPWPKDVGKKVNFGDVVFVKTDYLPEFFEHIHPTINCRYILMTHNSDYGITDEYVRYLNDNKLIAWYAQNILITHPKLHPIPIGCANRYIADTGCIEKVDEMRKQSVTFRKDILLYMNFNPNTYPERSTVFELFKNKPFCVIAGRKKFVPYLQDVARCCFVLSPRGNGLDCHRTWEALYLGAIPIVKTSSLDQLYEGLPVLIVQDWQEVTKEFLEKKYEEIRNKPVMFEKLFIDYWVREVEKIRKASKVGLK